MNLNDRISAFSELGETLRNALQGAVDKNSEELDHLIETRHLKNPWFTPENVRRALSAIAKQLTNENLTKWTGMYPALQNRTNPFNAGIIMAGNIPLVGFHDFLTVLISGNNLIAKTSSKDPDLILFISKILAGINPEFTRMIHFTDGTLKGFDAVIATGSDNSARYFEYYFGKYPHIIRKNRNSIAIIDGSESDDDLKALGDDIFSYFGLGCRNVSKIYIPEGYDLNRMTCCWSSFEPLRHHSKYANNYDFSKAVFIVNREEFSDTGFLLMKESTSLSSPVAVLYFECYPSNENLNIITETISEKIQCIAGNEHTPFGRTQSPQLWDYADKVDTMEFLLKKK